MTKKEVTPPVETKDVISVEKPEKVTVEEGTTFEDLKKDLPEDKVDRMNFSEAREIDFQDHEDDMKNVEYK